MQLINHMRLEFDARPENESFARIAVSAFTVPFNPTLDVLYISYPVSWLVTFLIHMGCYIVVARKMPKQAETA